MVLIDKLYNILYNIGIYSRWFDKTSRRVKLWT